MRPETTHLVGRVVDIHPLMGKMETLVGEGGFGGVGDQKMFWLFNMLLSGKSEDIADVLSISLLHPNQL